MEGEKLEYYGKYLEYSVMNMRRNEWNKTGKKSQRTNMMEWIWGGWVKCDERNLKKKKHWDTIKEFQGKWLEWLIIWCKKTGEPSKWEWPTQRNKNLQVESTGNKIIHVQITGLSKSMKGKGPRMICENGKKATHYVKRTPVWYLRCKTPIGSYSYNKCPQKTSRAHLVSHVGETSYDRKRAECVCRNLCGDNKWLAHSQQCMASTMPAEDDSCSFLSRVSCHVSVRKPSLTKLKINHSIHLL